MDNEHEISDFHEASDFAEYFRKLRFDKRFHLGLGDIRLTMGMQEELIAEIERLCNLIASRPRP